MNQQAGSNLSTQSRSANRHILIIGGGPVGVRFAAKITELDPSSAVVIFNNEINPPYNRARLSLLLAGQVSLDNIDLASTLPQSVQCVNLAIAKVDTQNQVAVDSSGKQHRYDTLIFATGASAFVPDIPGNELDGVFLFRSLRNTEALLARTVKTREVVVVGGGILGVETAVAMARFNTKVTLVHQAEHLLNRQLDTQGAQRLQESITEAGIKLVLGSGVRAILGQQTCQGVRLRNGTELACDTIVLCCGSSPNIALARDASVKINRGILVDNGLATSAANVFAIGECCEHNEQNYGLITPGYEQASVLASRLCGEDTAYRGSSPESLLKVLDFPLRTFGTPTNFRRTPFIRECLYQSDTQYLKLITSKSKLIGGVLIGETAEAAAIIDLYQRQNKLPWHRRLLFKLFGQIWPLTDQNQPQMWSEKRLVCRCQNVSVGQINSAITLGATSLSCLGRELKAGITCGSCQPDLANLLQSQTGNQQMLLGHPLWRSSLFFAVLALLAIYSFSSISGIQHGESIQAPGFMEWFWGDKFWKQVSGFTLLGLTAAGLVVSLRKRIARLKFGEFAYWRFFHVVLGASCLGVLALHTGLHMGANLNRWLIVNYLILLCLGALTAATIAISHRFSGHKSKLIRRSWSWLHILAAWPLPPLLAVHIASVYRF